ncbi:MAG: hypothetical protein Q9N67_01260 [Ghiorsea sp.]|nr:hypothetical protein [Ghiorsea sp.]
MKETLGLIAVAITLIAFYPYTRSILRGNTKPHVFSWVIWGLTTFVVFLGQLEDGGGAGAWSIGVSGLITMFVAFLAYRKKAGIHITKIDWIFFLSALASIPLWLLTSDPMLTVVLLTVIDAFGFAPTFRKSYHNPYDEPIDFYVWMTVRNVVAIAALMSYSVTTVIFPAVTGILGLLYVLMVAVRRKQVAG